MICKTDLKFNILDAGARFGIHESWLDYQGPAHFCLFEPDPEEAERLTGSYKDNPRVEVVQMALAEKAGYVVLNQLRHRGGTTILTPDSSARYWSSLRPNTGNIEGRIDVKCIDIDTWSKQRSINFDFFKIDVEGAECDLIRGAREQLTNSVLGVRAEVLLNSLYTDQGETFSTINSLLLSCGFMFLNFDSYFSNSQAPFSDLYTGERFGQLIGVDGIWVKPPEAVLRSDTSSTDPSRVLKLAYFSLRNGAQDYGMDLLINAAEQGLPMTLEMFVEDQDQGTRDAARLAIYQLEKEAARLLFALRDRPRYSADYLGSVFQKIFCRPWVKPGEYYHRYPLVG